MLREILIGILAVALIGATLAGSGGGKISENAIKNAIWPYGDDDFVVFDDTVTVSIDITDPEDRDIAYPCLFKNLFAIDEVGRVILAGYTKENGKKDYQEWDKEILTRQEWEEAQH